MSSFSETIKIKGYIFYSEGSVLVDYNVELNDLGRRVDTQEIKKLFHESLDDALSTFGSSNREGKAINESMKLEGKLALGSFVVDPAYTDFLGRLINQNILINNSKCRVKILMHDSVCFSITKTGLSNCWLCRK